MDGFSFLAGSVLPYAAVLIFVVGMARQFYIWANLARPGMTLFPAPAKGGGMVRGVIVESLFFRNLLKSDKVFWAGAWIFHATLALIILGHLRVFSALPDWLMGELGMSEEAILAMSNNSGGAAGVIIFLTLLYLLLRRLGIQRVREISSPADFAAVVLILAIVFTGNLMRFGEEHFNLSQAHAYFAGLLKFSPREPFQALAGNATFVTHFLLVQVLLIVIPFSKILHFGGIFFSHALVKRR